MSKVVLNNQAYKLIQDILINEWDPIGIKNIPEAVNEYDQYISRIYDIVISDKNYNYIVNYLYWLETEHIGLIGNMERVKKVSHKLINIIDRV